MVKRNSNRLRAGLTTTTRTETQTKTESLTALEEHVVRMTRGLSEADGVELTFASTSDPEVNARLLLIEATLMAEMHGLGPLAVDGDDPKAKIMRHLKSLD